MTEAAWDHVKRIVAAALERDTSERETLVTEMCGDDHGLRAEVMELLEHDRRAEDFFEIPTATRLPADHDTGRTVGRYTIRRTIASGGMGVVYEAVQDHPHRIVALKVLLHGAARWCPAASTTAG